MSFTFVESTEWWLEISPEVRESAWQKSQICTTPGGRWNAYLNQMCLDHFLPWFQSEYAPEATCWLSDEELPALWEMVNGSAIAFPGNQATTPTRLVLIPSDAIEDEILEVPQEWVDIPGWIGDYYLAVQVNPDEDYIRIWGYTTHEKLKAKSQYDVDERICRINDTDLVQDMNTFRVTHQLCPQLQTRVEVAALTAIAPAQAENLIQRLSHRSVTFPRLEVPFETWGAILQDGEWRSRLVQQRTQEELSLQPQMQLPVRLNEWLQNSFTGSWQTLEALLGTDFAFSFGVRNAIAEQESIVKRAKLLDLGIQLSVQPMVLLVALLPEPDERVSIRIQLHPAPGLPHLPADLKLMLLSDTQEVLQETQSRERDLYIQLKRFSGEVSETFTVQITFGEAQFTEEFVI